MQRLVHGPIPILSKFQIIRYQGRIESVGPEGMQLQCSVLKHQNSYEFIHDLKNSNNIHESTGVYQLKWRHSLLERLLTKKTPKDQGSGQ